MEWHFKFGCREHFLYNKSKQTEMVSCYSPVGMEKLLLLSESLFYIAVSNITQILLASGALVVVAVILGCIVLWLRRRLLSLSAYGTKQGDAFTINQLESLHESGRISDEEFSRMRRAILSLKEPENITSQSSDTTGNADEEEQPSEE